jgi:hypothetical protein
MLVNDGPMTSTVLETTVNCKLLDKERIENPAGGAASVDEFLTFTLSVCAAKPSLCAAGAVVEIAVTVPMATHLIDDKLPITDVIESRRRERTVHSSSAPRSRARISSKGRPGDTRITAKMP